MKRVGFYPGNHLRSGESWKQRGHMARRSSEDAKNEMLKSSRRVGEGVSPARFEAEFRTKRILTVSESIAHWRSQGYHGMNPPP